MNYEPLNGPRITVVETTILCLIFCVVLLAIRMFRRFTFPGLRLNWLIANNLWAVVIVITAAMIGRALLLPVLGVPEPRINDEFAHLLTADTFSHFRLTNSTPAAWQNFETFHVNIRPTYHAMYPAAQGLTLALGQLIFHQPWIGVYLSTALLCGVICWTLQAFVPPAWALVGGLLAVVRIAWLSYWMNSYWGGSVAALGGALALGTVVRLFEPERSNRSRPFLASGFAVGLLILATSRPYEGLAFSFPLFAYFGYRVLKFGASRALVQQMLLPVAIIGSIGVSAMGYYNHATTGNALLMPYMQNHRTYWPPPFFLGQKENRAVQPTDPVFEKFFRVTEEEYSYAKTKSVSGLLNLETERFAQYWFFYVGPALSFPVLVGFLSSVRQSRLRLVVFVTLSTGLALALCVYSQPHYAAPATIALYVFAAEGLRYFWDEKRAGERAFVVAVLLTIVLASFTRQTGSTAINAKFHFADGRKAVTQQLKNQPGRHIVLVAYELEKHYPPNELVHNWADFKSERVLWARSKGPLRDWQLCAAYPDRTFWSVTTDDVNVSLKPLNLCNPVPATK